MDPNTDDSAELLPFDASLQIGLPAVDRQHRALINELNRLIADTAAVPSSEAFSDILTQIGRQLGAHFGYEESLFEALGLSGEEIARHLAAHEEILSQYVELNIDLMHAQTRTRPEVLAMVRDWVRTHIVVHDLGLRDRAAG